MAYVAIAATLSYFELYNSENKVYFSKPHILNQMLGMLIYPIIILYFSLLLSNMKGSSFLDYGKVITAFYFIFMLVHFYMTRDFTWIIHNIKLGQFFNIQVFFLFFLMFLLHFRIDNLKKRLFLLLCLLPLTGSSQSFIAILIAICLVFSPPKYMLPLFVGALFLSITTSLFFIPELRSLDHNTGIRSLFWLGAISDFINSFGVGIGFGSEALRISYHTSTEDVAILNPVTQFEQFITTGVHNSFFDVMQRLGAAGLSVFLYLVFAPMIYLYKTNMTSFDCWVACTLVLTLTVNVALSINFIFGTALMHGWIIYRAHTCSEHKKSELVLI
jgi:hypothetical protein